MGYRRLSQSTENAGFEAKKQRLREQILEKMGEMPKAFMDQMMNGETFSDSEPMAQFWQEFLGGSDFGASEFARQMGSFFKSPPEDTSPLVIMRKDGSRTPFFCVHALLGSVYHYHHLANRISDDQPFYGLQARGLDGTEEPLERIEDMAELYIQTMREVQPHGPYLLGGYSFGGWIAFEMARRLQLAGESIMGLMIIGAGLPPAAYHPTFFRNADFLARYAQDFQKNVMEPFLSYEERMAGGFDQDPSKMNPIHRVYLAHSKARMTYVPYPYGGPITLFETIEQQLIAPFDWVGGWDQLTQSTVERHLISGNHYSMLDEPVVNELSEKLDMVLDRIHASGVGEAVS